MSFIFPIIIHKLKVNIKGVPLTQYSIMDRVKWHTSAKE